MKSDLKSILDQKKIPTHVAIIMDGNGRWAKKQLMNRINGHEKGAQVVHSIVVACRKLGIKILTLYAFSTENWNRSKQEIQALMRLLKKFVISQRKDLLENNIKLHIIGQKQRLSKDVQKEIDITQDLTKNNEKMILNLALSYGSRQEIVSAVKQIAKKTQSNEIKLDDINEDLVSNHLYTKNMKDPDLMIRTGKEFRLSNFLLWQSAYTEIFVSDTLWPDFCEEELLEILKAFQKRNRRFGKA